MLPNPGAVISCRLSTSVESTWQMLVRELDEWGEHDRIATFWWRDDDATRKTTDLARLLRLARHYDAPLFVAAIPAACNENLVDALHEAPNATVLQHGHAHVDLSPESLSGCAELDSDLPDFALMRRLYAGRDRLEALFDKRFAPVMVPPWNRISSRIRNRLPTCGFHGLSTFGPRREARPVTGLLQINTHCDIVNWKRGGRFRGTDRLIDEIVEHLRGRRTGAVDAGEPTGILTHHLDHDEACWQFLELLLLRLAAHPAARLLGRETFRV